MTVAADTPRVAGQDRVREALVHLLCVGANARGGGVAWTRIAHALGVETSEEIADALLSRPAPEPSGEVGAFTAKEIFEISQHYDQEQRGGVGRGEIDEELAFEFAARFNERLAAVRAERQPEGDELQAAPMTPHRAEFLNLVALEVEHAQRKHGTGFTNRHEMYAVLLEEVEELWETVKRNESTTRSIEEAVQVAAVVTKWYEGVRADSPTRPAPPVEVTQAMVMRAENPCGCVAERVTGPVIRYVETCEKHIVKLDGMRLVGPDSPEAFRTAAFRPQPETP